MIITDLMIIIVIELMMMIKSWATGDDEIMDCSCFYVGQVISLPLYLTSHKIPVNSSQKTGDEFTFRAVNVYPFTRLTDRW